MKLWRARLPPYKLDTRCRIKAILTNLGFANDKNGREFTDITTFDPITEGSNQQKPLYLSCNKS